MRIARTKAAEIARGVIERTFNVRVFRNNVRMFVTPGHFYSPIANPAECDRHIAKIDAAGVSDAGEVPDAQQDRQDAQQDRQDAQQDRQVGQHVTSAIEPSVDLSASRQTMVPQLTRVPDLPRSHELIARKVATIPYKLSVASAQPASGALVQARPSASQASAGVANFNLVFLGAAATGLSLAGGVFHLTRRVRSSIPHSQIGQTDA